MIVYGIATCDTTKAALKALQKAGKTPVFRDVRANPLTETEIAVLVQQFGDRIINKQSTTYRGFSDWLRASDPEAQIAAQPAVMKRPAIDNSGVWHLGWDADVEALLTS